MLRVGLCGGVSVEIDGRPLPDALLAGRQGRLVLAYLVCERHRAVPREELAELLWGERVPSSWSSSLSVVVSKLRRMLARAGLDPTTTLASVFGSSYRLHLPDNAWVDWEAAADAVERAERAVHAGDLDTAITSAKEAREIAQRGFLTDDCRWVDVRRDRLRDLQIRAIHAQARAQLAASEAGRAVIAARDALAVDELRETSYRLLMECLGAAGERAEALRVWERCRVMLADELGVDPTSETEALYLSLLGVVSPPSSTLPSGVVTFLLTDIVDSSAIWDRNPAAMAIALERHDGLVAEAVGSHGGVVLKAKLEGDATVSVFPRASAAALAALTLRDTLNAESWPDEATIELRMALHTGEAIEREGDYFGPALNRAARLRALAGVGQILMSQTVADVVRDHLPDSAAVASLGEHQLRGLARGEHIFELGAAPAEDTAERPTPQRPPLPGALAARGPFVGRRAELDRLAAEWVIASGGRARAMLIAGEPGVGKSRLAAEWARRAYEEGALVLYGRCDEELGAPYQPFAEALRVLLPAFGAPRLRDVRAAEHLARLTPELTDLLPRGTAPAQADPDTERAMLFDALARLFVAVSTEAPLVVVIDDLHWAGKPTLLLLRHLLRAGEGSRLLIVGTYRSTDLSRAHPLAGVLADLHRDQTAERLILGGLAADDVATFVRDAGHDDTRLGEALSTVTSGNPFFVIEVLRHLEETDGAWDPTTLPQGVREAVDRRLSQLSDHANEALLVGAVAGSQFSLDLIEHVMEHDLVDAIDEARRAGLLVEEIGGRFRFNHALVRQSLLAECVTVKRLRIHQRIAAALEADPAGAGEAHLADLARHWFECAFAGGAAKAVDYSRRAGDQAMSRLAYEEAADLYGQALQAADVDASGCRDDDRAELMMARCEALLAAGDPAAAAGVVEELARAARSSTRLTSWATCFAAQLAVLIHPEQLQTTVAEVSLAADAFARLGDAEGEAKAHTVAASCLARLGRIGDCEAALDRALVAARLASNPRRVNAVLGFAPLAALYGPNPVPQASGRCLDVVRVLRITTGSAAVEAAALRCQAVLEAVRGRFDAARRMLASTRRSLESLGHAHGLLETDLFAGLVEFSAGQPAAAARLLQHAYEGFLARGVGVDAAQAAAYLARATLVEGRIDDALALTEQAERLAGADLKASMAWRAARAEALAKRGDLGPALDLARDAVALVESTDALLDGAEAYLTLSVVLRAIGDEAGAEREAQHAIELYERKGATAAVDAARHLLGPASAPAALPAPSAAAWRRVRPNLATTGQALAVQLHPARDFDAWAATLALDFVDVDHVVHLSSDRATFIDNAVSHGAMERLSIDTELLTSLGERYVLSRITYRYTEHTDQTGESEVTRLHVMGYDVQGRLLRSERFGEDSLHLALARLIELHADDELPRERRETQYTIAARIREPLQRGRWSDDAVIAEQWSDDAVIVDHRPAGLGQLHGEDAIEFSRHSARRLSDDARWQLTDVLALAERVNVLDAVLDGHDEQGGHFQIRVIAVQQYGEDGRLHRVDSYGPDQIDEALRRFDELTSEAGDGYLVNDASHLNTRLRHGVLAGDWESVAALMTDDVEIDDRRPIVGHRSEGREAVFGYQRSVFESGLTHLSSVELATRGNRLVLSRTSAGGPRTQVDALAVAEVSVDGRSSAEIVFDASNLDAAFDELDSRYLAGEGAPYTETLRPCFELTAAHNRQDWARCRQLLADGFTLVDRAEAKVIGEIDSADQFVTVMQSRFESARDVRGRLLAVHAVEHGGAVFLGQMTSTTSEGAEIQLLLHVLFITQNGRIARLEHFPRGQLGAARARLRELCPPAPAVPAPASRSRRVRPNAATAQLTGDSPLIKARLFDRWATQYSEDFVDVDHISHITSDRETWLTAARKYASIDELEMDFEVLASLGERHALSRYIYRHESGTLIEPGNTTGPLETVQLLVTRTDVAGRLSRLDRFRVTDLHLALARLIELHADDELPSGHLPGRYTIAAMFRDRHVGWSDDAVLVDHRPVSPGTVKSRDAIRRAVATLRDPCVFEPWRVTDVFAFTERLALIEFVSEGQNDEGGPVQFEAVSLQQYSDDGRLLRTELYSPEQIDEAFRQFEKLLDEAELRPAHLTKAPPAGTVDRRSRRRVRPNIATEAGEHAKEHMRAGDLNALAGLYTADLVDVDHTSHVVTGRDDLLRMVRIYFATEHHAVDSELLATLGERHLLSRTTTRMEGAAMADSAIRTGAIEMVLLTLNSVDAAGHTTRIERFGADDLHLALARLVELHAEEELPEDRRTERSTISTQLREQLFRRAKDATLVDHRPATAGSDGVAAMTEDRPCRIIDVLVFTEELVLTELVPNPSDHGSSAPKCSVLSLDQFGADGLVHRAEWYLSDQIDEAFARFEELCSTDGSREFPPPNTAALALRRADDAFDRRDPDAYLGCFAPAVVHEDRRPGVRLSFTGRDAIEQNAREMMGVMAQVGAKLLATRGDRLSLSRLIYRGEAGDWGAIESELIHLIETDPDGLIRYTIIFGLDDLDAAYAELDARYLAGEGAPFADCLTRLAEATASYNGRDWDRFEALYPEDSLVIDHRLTGWGTLDRANLLEHVRGTVERVVAEVRLRVPAVVRLTEQGMVFVATGTDPTGDEFEIQLVVVEILAHGRLKHQELFSLGDVENALRRFDELTAASTPSTSTTWHELFASGQIDEAARDASSSDPQDQAQLATTAAQPAPLPLNACARVVAACDVYARDGDLESLIRTYAPDCTFEDRRPGFRLTLSRAELEDNIRIGIGFMQGSLPERTLVATRGERLALSSVVHRGSSPLSGDAEIAGLALFELDDGGLISRTTYFDPTDLDAAFDELDARFATGEGEPFDWAAHTARSAAYNRRDWAAFEARLTDDVQYVDHRPARFGVQNRAELMSNMRALIDLVPDAKLWILAVPLLTADGQVTVFERIGHDDTGALVTWREAAVTMKECGLDRWIESFPFDELPAALSRFEELGQSFANKREPMNPDPKTEGTGPERLA
jgi:class 3 adenylate cyclase/tetratricopeptide (TPR) repeat protein